MADRSALLSQVAAGQLSAEEAASRLTAPAAPAAPALDGRWLRIRITRLSTGAGKVAVTLPLAWVDLGLRLGARQAPELDGLEWTAVLEQLQASGDAQLLEVEDLDKDERIEISVE
ncbi:MAG: hypothetical protein JNK29_14960 [Anaerolineales bacterium]|nr:hypothetical protein [Anaerolineales bacterium]